MSKEDLVNWLSVTSRDVATCAAMRASLRAAPIGLIQLPGIRRVAPSSNFRALRIFRSLAANWAITAFPGYRDTLSAATITSISGSATPDIQRAAEYVTASIFDNTDRDAIASAEQCFDDLFEVIAARGKEAFDDFLEACSTDASILDQGTNPVVLALSQLWPGAPAPWWCMAEIEELKLRLNSKSERWDIWTKWYDERLRGNTPDQSVEVARVTIPDDLWDSPQRANDYIGSLIEEPKKPTTTLGESNLEEQIFGLSFRELPVVGLRASLRAVPFLLDKDRPESKLAPDLLSVLRVVSSAWAASIFPEKNPQMQAALATLHGPIHPLLAAAIGGNSYSSTGSRAGATSEVVALAIAELRFFINDADDRAAAVIFGMSVSDDINDLQGASPIAVAQLPLWSGGVPPALTSERWEKLKQKLISLGVGWEVWINWYEDRLTGGLRSEEREFAYVDVPSDLWASGPAPVNAWILKRIEQLSSQPVSNAELLTSLPIVPALQPAAIEPIWQKGRLTINKTAAKTDLKGRAFTAALKSLREELLTFANDISEQANIDKRFVSAVLRLSDEIPRKAPVQSEIFRLGHAETIFAGYAQTVDAEWPSFLATQYHALALHFDRTMRQVPLWREFKRNAAKGTLTPSQVLEATVLANELASTLRFDEAEGIVDAAVPQAVEQMAASLHAALTAKTADGAIEAGAELLAYDVVESVNNVLKSIFGAALWAETTFGKAGTKFTAAAQKSIVDEAGRLGKNVGPAITKWAKRTVKVGIGTGSSVYVGKPLLLWLTSTYPEIFGWLIPIIHLF